MSITLQANCANVSVRVFLYVASRFADNEQISFGNNFDGNNTTETTATKLQNSLHFKLKSVRDTEVTPSDSTLELFRNSWHPVGSSYFFSVVLFLARAFCGWQLTQCCVAEWQWQDLSICSRGKGKVDSDIGWSILLLACLAIGFWVSATLFKLKCCH